MFRVDLSPSIQDGFWVRIRIYLLNLTGNFELIARNLLPIISDSFNNWPYIRLKFAIWCADLWLSRSIRRELIWLTDMNQSLVPLLSHVKALLSPILWSVSKFITLSDTFPFLCRLTREHQPILPKYLGYLILYWILHLLYYLYFDVYRSTTKLSSPRSKRLNLAHVSSLRGVLEVDWRSFRIVLYLSMSLFNQTNNYNECLVTNYCISQSKYPHQSGINVQVNELSASLCPT